LIIVRRISRHSRRVRLLQEAREVAPDFDLLKQWASWDDDEIKKVVSDDTIETLQRVVRLLADESIADSRVVTRDNFVATVREMRELYREGSWQLGEAIIEASDLADNRELAKAREVYERFLASCGSKFYRDIARNRLKKLGASGTA
jgi:hypothetical protein